MHKQHPAQLVTTWCQDHAPIMDCYPAGNRQQRHRGREIPQGIDSTSQEKKQRQGASSTPPDDAPAIMDCYPAGNRKTRQG